MVLDEVRKMNAHRHLSVNVVSFNCDEKSANDFLSQLASENHGRYHRSSKSDKDIHLFAHKILTEGVQDSYVIFLSLLIFVVRLLLLINVTN